MKSLSKIVFLTFFLPVISQANQTPASRTPNMCTTDLAELSVEDSKYCVDFIKDVLVKDIESLNKSIINVLIRDQNEESVKLFKESIKAWEELKDKTCKIKSLGFEDPVLLAYICDLEYLESRATELKNLNDFLEPPE